MKAIYPSTALKTRQREMKALADEQIVYITENGHGAYAFMSEAVLDRYVADAVEEALYEARMHEALAQSRADFEAGRIYDSLEGLLSAVEKKRASRG